MQDASASKDAEMMKHAQAAMIALRTKYPDLFGNISKETIAEYSCFGTAMVRARLAKQPGSICDDHVVEKICGEEGAAFANATASVSYFTGPELCASMSLRTYFVDYTIKHRHPSIHQVVILGSGFDTRAFRLQELADCHVIEVDGSKLIQDFKQRRINELKLPVLAKQRDVLVMNLGDPSWPERLIALGFKPNEPTFWLAEGLLMYLTPEQNNALLTAIDKLSAPHSEMFCNMSGGGETFIKDAMISGERLRKDGEDNELLKALPWTNEIVLNRTNALEYSGSLWDTTQFKDYTVTRKEDAVMGPFFYSWLKKPAVEEH